MTLILDKRGIPPTYVYERDGGMITVRNQFTDTVINVNTDGSLKKGLREAMQKAVHADIAWRRQLDAERS